MTGPHTGYLLLLPVPKVLEMRLWEPPRLWEPLLALEEEASFPEALLLVSLAVAGPLGGYRVSGQYLGDP